MVGTSKKFVLIAFGLLVVVGALYLFLFRNSPIATENMLKKNKTHATCLADNEVAEYTVTEGERAPSSATVLVKNEDAQKLIFSFVVNNFFDNHYHSYEVYKCGFYLIREFNYDYVKGKTMPDYRMEVWRYTYDGLGQKLVESNDFRVDPQEKYIVFKSGYSGVSDYALVFKNLKTLEDAFVLKFNDLVKEFGIKPAEFGLGIWRGNGEYLWTSLFNAAHTDAYLRITSGTWDVNVYPTPDDYTGGLLSSPTGEYILYTNGPGFIGIDVIAEQIWQEWRDAGKKKSLFVYNLYAREKKVVATVDEPSWNFKTKWLSDTEFEYFLPTGERKVFKVE